MPHNLLRLQNLFLPGTLCLPPFPDVGHISLATENLPLAPDAERPVPLLQIVYYDEPAKTTTWSVRLDLVVAVVFVARPKEGCPIDRTKAKWFFLPLDWNERRHVYERLNEALKDTPLGNVFVPEETPLITSLERGYTARQSIAWSRQCDPDRVRYCDPDREQYCDPDRERYCDPNRGKGRHFSVEDVLGTDDPQ